MYPGKIIFDFQVWTQILNFEDFITEFVDFITFPTSDISPYHTYSHAILTTVMKTKDYLRFQITYFVHGK